MGGNGRVTRCGAHKRRQTSGPSARSVDGFVTACENDARALDITLYTASVESDEVRKAALLAVMLGVKTVAQKKRKVGGVWPSKTTKA